ncbi:TIGR02921 family PEP-CTERM protein [Plectonema cf. radiosum LEGE 06105]|uniref:TIGR02921 family PEP-CTERM protein n=1 Tax=Plectonema cf. radiosum LEGE 06105 TaxID=945769 RepID=A0A8J7EWQ5_9CYAN|nr:TIGR02921 family PEP-CTERM protein [Plectonema radiosum]MBE9211506.1 TIGR02921 family PEP-CTERM protein [Plectonema cf. radiosum LEGE 06105]
MKTFWNATFYAIFWLWNITFLAVVYFGILPFLAPWLFSATLRGEIPIEFSLTLISLIAVPTVSSILGAWKFIKQPLQLIRLFYGVEAPLFILCCLRLFLIREMTPASIYIIATAGLSITAFFVDLLWGYNNRRQTGLQWMQMFANSLMLLFGVYAGVLLLFYALPLTAVILQEFIKFHWLSAIRDSFTRDFFTYGLWYVPFLLLLFTFSAFLLVIMPSVMSAMYIYSGQKTIKEFAARYGNKRTFTGSSAVLAAAIVLFISLQQQPQVKAFSLLNNPANTDSNRQTLLSKSNQIQEGLVNAYLSSYRYLSTRKDSNSLSAMYRQTLGLNKSAADAVQEVHNFLISPFLYNGSEQDIKKAEKLYEEFFDKPIQKAEAPAITHAVQSTFNQQEVKAGLLNINEKKVWLESQQITVKENGDRAEVELYEVYKNQTPEVQEIFYYFSLPESAVITGLWLGDTSDLNKRFEFVVSPRGAAQKVYNSQVRRERPVDPALLEQVGPRNYRLRAFPIPRNNVEQIPNQPPVPTEMNLWLTYQVMVQDKGVALPILGEKRNIFWTDKTKRIRNGKQVKIDKDIWLEDFITLFPVEDYRNKNRRDTENTEERDKKRLVMLDSNRSNSKKFKPKSHAINLPEGYKISAKPLSNKDYSLPKNKRFALVIDSSRSMGSHVKELSQNLTWLQKHLKNNDVDLYITASGKATPQRLDDIRKFKADKFTFYGSLQTTQMLKQFNQLQGETSYDAILLLTDAGNYELAKNNKDIPNILAPLWIVHNGELPPAYTDGIIKAIQDSGGGVSTSVSEVLQRIATKTTLGESVIDVVDGYAWYLEQSDNNSTQQSDFQQLAARQLIRGLSKQVKLDNLESLDAIHGIAKKYKLVSPYSSMLVLVNDEQRRLLKEAEAAKDRFDRNLESGKEDLTKPNNPLKTSIPESSNAWVLVGSSLLLLWFVKRKH